MKSTKQVTEKDNIKYEVEVVRAHTFSDTRTGFDAIVNGVKIFGLLYIEHEKGDFISFPSYKDKKGAKDDKGKDIYWNHVWFATDDELIKDIKAKIEALL